MYMTNMTRCSMLPLMHSQPQLGALDARDAAGVGLAAAVRGATRAVPPRARASCRRARVGRAWCSSARPPRTGRLAVPPHTHTTTRGGACAAHARPSMEEGALLEALAIALVVRQPLLALVVCQNHLGHLDLGQESILVRISNEKLVPHLSVSTVVVLRRAWRVSC